MRVISAGALALVVSAVHGFRDTSPFFMFSTSKSADSFHTGYSADSHPRLLTASSLTSDLLEHLSHCPTDLYILVSQPGVRSTDYASSKTTPALSRKMNDKTQGIRSSIAIDEVIGDLDVKSFHEILQSKCGAQVVEVDAASGIPTEQNTLSVVYDVNLPAPSTPEELTENDAFFASVMDIVQSQTYTVLYVTSPGEMSRRVRVTEAGLYEMESQVQEAVHFDLRRDLSSGMVKSSNNETLVDGPLFDRYQFFTPGLFMGFVVSFILLSIAYVGISALTSLQVSYAAFEKESGPLAPKKAQ